MTPLPGVTIVPYGPGTSDERAKRLAGLIEQHEVVISQIPPYLHLPAGVLSNRYFVIDLYAPWILEKLEYARIDPERGDAQRKDDLEILTRLLQVGDYFICASERQRDFWLGALTAAGRLSVRQSGMDPELRNLIDIVPFGLPERKPIPSGPGPRERFEPIGERDAIVLWNGGIWNWLDPETAIRAIKLLVDEHRDCRLVFMGTRSPGHEIAEMAAIERAIALSDELKLTGEHVFFNDWVPYAERQNWIMQASMTLSLHHPTIESRFAFRTRVLDNLWCRVPVVATGGDVMADLITAERIGEVVPAADPLAVANAIKRLLDREHQRRTRQHIARVADRYTWEKVTLPLTTYCAEPWSNRDSASAGTDYVHKLERLYTETADYARHLERAVAEKEQALTDYEGSQRVGEPSWKSRLRAWRNRI